MVSIKHAQLPFVSKDRVETVAYLIFSILISATIIKTDSPLKSVLSLPNETIYSILRSKEYG